MEEMPYKKLLLESNILLHIPHASLNIPPDDRGYFLLDDRALEKEKLAMTDLHMDLMCESIKANMLIADISRLVVDMERYVDDSKEAMARYGMGVVYTASHDGSPLRNVQGDYKAVLISKYYKPYHNELKTMCEDIVRRHGKCIIVDMHSFPTEPVSGVNYSEELPEICIGLNGEENSLAASARLYFEAKGYGVRMNYPYSGSIVPSGLDVLLAGNVESIMIEINRSLYMDEATGALTEGFDKIRKNIHDFFTIFLNDE